MYFYLYYATDLTKNCIVDPDLPFSSLIVDLKIVQARIMRVEGSPEGQLLSVPPSARHFTVL